MVMRSHLLGYPPVLEAIFSRLEPRWAMKGYDVLEVENLYPLGMPVRVQEEFAAELEKKFPVSTAFHGPFGSVRAAQLLAEYDHLVQKHFLKE